MRAERARRHRQRARQRRERSPASSCRDRPSVRSLVCGDDPVARRAHVAGLDLELAAARGRARGTRPRPGRSRRRRRRAPSIAMPRHLHRRFAAPRARRPPSAPPLQLDQRAPVERAHEDRRLAGTPRATASSSSGVDLVAVDAEQDQLAPPPPPPGAAGRAACRRRNRPSRRTRRRRRSSRYRCRSASPGCPARSASAPTVCPNRP